MVFTGAEKMLFQFGASASVFQGVQPTEMHVGMFGQFHKSSMWLRPFLYAEWVNLNVRRKQSKWRRWKKLFFFLFQFSGDTNTAICTMLESKCCNKADILFSADFEIDECNCLPDCNSITYDVEISQTKMIYFSGSDSLNSTRCARICSISSFLCSFMLKLQFICFLFAVFWVWVNCFYRSSNHISLHWSDSKH